MAVLEMEERRRRNAQAASTGVEPSDGVAASGSAETAAPDAVRSVNADVSEPSGRVTPEMRWLAEVREELDDYLVQLRSMRSKDPTDVFMILSGISARLTELRIICMRQDSRRTTALRVREIDPMLDECERQFRFHSRIQAVRSQEWEMTRGLT